MDNKPLITINISGNSLSEVQDKISLLYADFLHHGEGDQAVLPTKEDYVVDTQPEPVDVPSVSTKGKRGRKPKQQSELPAEPPVATQPEPLPTVEENLTVAVPEVQLPTYSLADFQMSFAIILNQLMLDRVLTPLDISNYCEKFGIKFIYELSNKHDKLAEIYSDLVAKKFIAPKAEY